ncbi:MAG: phospholipase D family protein [Gammaproteobacteria bacterium]|nr:phospholipase D family protein [Gammaproteobacteria bacterium]
MLSPDQRTVAMDMLRPPAGYRIDQAVLTTYSLDLDVLLALPLAVLAHSDRGVDELLADPLLLLEALREAGERLNVFVDETGIAVPHTNRALYALLEDCVHPVRAPGGGAFHPKVWVVRFVDEAGQPLIRAAVSSRNLTFDRSWDVALVSESEPAGRRKIPESRGLTELLRAVPGFAVRELPSAITGAVEALADEVARTTFPGPERCHGPVVYQALGLAADSGRRWKPDAVGRNLLAVAPFVNRTGLAQLVEVKGERTLVSRREALDELPAESLAEWDSVLVLSEAAMDEPEDGTANRPSDLHAKMIAVEHGKLATWFVGSANLTAAAFGGRNVEVIAAITGARGKADSGKGYGIGRFREAGFLNLCEPYHRDERVKNDDQLDQARRLLEDARAALVSSELTVRCRSGGEAWRWVLEGELALPSGVSAEAWPVSVGEDQARELAPPLEWSLPLSRLTTFVAVRLSVEANVDDIRLVLKLPATGMPAGRVAQVLRSLIDSPERFLTFLRALLGGLEGLADWMDNDGNGAWQGEWAAGLAGETLLEDLLRDRVAGPGAPGAGAAPDRGPALDGRRQRDRAG